MFRNKFASLLMAGIGWLVLGLGISFGGAAYRSVPSRAVYSPVATAPSSFPEVRFLGRRVVFRDAERAPAATESQDRAYFTVRLPAEAELWINNVRSAQRGDSRRFNTPPLEMGRPYRYDIHARWLENGREVVRSRTLEVRAGLTTTLDFNGPAGIQASTSSQN